jgi:trk system potassium uptake protein TrkA
VRFVFVGSGSLAMLTGRMLAERRHEVVIVERDLAMIEQVREELDVGFIHGDGTRPAILREADPEATDLLFCLTHDDQANIIASLVARSLGFRRVVTKIEDSELEHICAELGLAESLVPMHMVGRYLADMAEGQNIIELADLLRGKARVFSFRVTGEQEGRIADLSLPGTARPICLYRDGDEFLFADADTRLREGDQVLLLTDLHTLRGLRARFG